LYAIVDVGDLVLEPAGATADEGRVTGTVIFDGGPVEELARSGSVLDREGRRGVKWVAIYCASDVAPMGRVAAAPRRVVKYKGGVLSDFVTIVEQGAGCVVENEDALPVVLNVTGYDLLISKVVRPKESLRIDVTDAEKWPIQILDVVNTRDAWIVPVKSPYYALTADDGSFTIRGLPPGKHTLRFWHPQIRFQDVFRRSALTIDVPDNKEADLKPIIVGKENIYRVKKW
jgi:hypothetical protein